MSQLPALLNTFEVSEPHVQCNTLNAVTRVIDVLDETILKYTVLPKLTYALEPESGCNVQVQYHALLCLQKLIDYLPRNDIIDYVLPALAEAPIEEPSILVVVAKIYKHMLEDKSRYGLTISVLATKVMPLIIPAVISPDLEEDDFSFVTNLLQEMLDQVTNGQRIKLKSEKVNSSSPSRIPQHYQITKDFRPVQMPDFCITPTPSFVVSGPARRQSADAVAKLMRATSDDSSPDTEPDDRTSFLRVMENSLKPRRHSDNAIIVPTVYTTSTNSTSTSNSNLNKQSDSSHFNVYRASSSNSLLNGRNRRRYSSVDTHEMLRFVNKKLDSAAETVTERFEQASKATSAAVTGLASSTSPTPSTSNRRANRRCSVADIISMTQSPNLSANQAKQTKSKSPSKKLFKKIGSEMNNLLKK